MKRYLHIILAVVALLVDVGFASWEQKEFDYYEIILERKPFGEPPEQPEPKKEPQTQVKPQQKSFARKLRLTALWKIDGVGVRVGIKDLQEKQNYTLGIGESAEGMELVSADYDSEKVVLKKGSEHAELALQTEGAKSVSASDAQKMDPAERLKHNSYLERRKARQERNTKKRPEPKRPKYTGEELKKRLQEVQMDAIRTGKPPLPIPLTPEMDKQLVEEGVLPPVE